MADVSQGTKDQKAKSHAIIVGLFPQFDENETLLNECTSRDSLIQMDKLCVTIQQRYTEQTVEDRWSHVINSLNEALVKRIHANGAAQDLSPSVYGLKFHDFRNAHNAAKLRTVNLANLFVMARDLDMVENADGIMVRREAALPPGRTNSVRSALRTSTTSQKPAQPDRDRSLQPSAAPSDLVGTSGRPLHKTYFNEPRHSDLTIVLSDRLVYVHCVMLCRVSGCFDLLLQDNHQVCLNK